MMSNGQAVLSKRMYHPMVQKLRRAVSTAMESGSPRRGKRRDIRSDRTKYQCIVNAPKDQEHKCIAFVRREIDSIHEESYKLLKEDQINDKDVYMSVYNMNQKLHHMKQILDTYCTKGVSGLQLLNPLCLIINDHIIWRFYMIAFCASRQIVKLAAPRF